jgi:hypothetical protein
MKTPDAIDDAISHMPSDEYIDIREVCDTWFKYGEVVTLEINTTLKTCVVLPIATEHRAP